MPSTSRDSRAVIADRLHSLAIHLLRRVARHDDSGGITGPRLSVLSVLVLGGGPRTLGELATIEHVRPPTMTRLIQAMEGEGLVARAPHPHDARAVRIRATREGARVLRDARKRRLAALETLIGAVSAPDLKVLRHAAEILEPLVR
jgi:DNA-binding MarR family transcriptional regulator